MILKVLSSLNDSMILWYLRHTLRLGGRTQDKWETYTFLDGQQGRISLCTSNDAGHSCLSNKVILLVAGQLSGSLDFAECNMNLDTTSVIF